MEKLESRRYRLYFSDDGIVVAVVLAQ